jgi:hypothetical protein
VQIGGAGAQQLQVLPARHLGAIHIRGGLLQRQRQPPEFPRDLLAGILVQIGDAGAQQPHRGRQVDHVQVHDRPQRGEPAAPGGGNHMTRDPRRKRPRRQPRQDIPGRVGIIEDQQPARHAAQRVMDLIPHNLRVGSRVQSQPGGQRSELVR